MMNLKNKMGVNKEIETLRAIAIIFVLLQHLGNLFPWSSKGFEDFQRIFQFWTGVDLFFCVSGFVIALSLIPDLITERNAPNYWKKIIAFWIRRAYRLLPSAWIWLIIVWLLSIFFNSTGAFGLPAKNFGDAIAGVLNIANIHFSQCRTLGVQCGVNTVYWSLSLEEQFYFIFPFICFIFGKRLPLLLIMIIMFQIFMPRSWNDPLLHVRTGALVIGVLIAIFSRRPEYADFCPKFLKNPLSIWTLFSILTVLLALIGASAWTVAPDYSFTIAAAISGVLVLLASYERGFVPSGSSLISWVASRSYAIYLVHLPVFLSVREIWTFMLEPHKAFGATYTLRFFTTGVVLTLLLAEANFRFIELPLRKYGRRVSERYLSP